MENDLEGGKRGFREGEGDEGEVQDREGDSLECREWGTGRLRGM